MKFARNHSNRNASDTNRKANRSRPLIEPCEPRQMMSVAPVGPVNFNGEYASFENGQVLAINLRYMAGSKSYVGDVDASGVDRRLNGKEASTGVLSGNIMVSGKKVPFNATLDGTTLTLSYPGVSSTNVATQVSTTPAAPPPALHSHTRSGFKFNAPGGWTTSLGTDGIVISSPNGTEQVSVIATVADGYYTVSQVADSEVANGGTILSSRLLSDGLVSSTEYKQAGIGLLQFGRKGVAYVSGQIIETLNFSNAGTSGQTLTLEFEVTAPQAKFAGICPTLINTLASVQLSPGSTAAKAPVHSKSHVPGTSGNWSTNAALAQEEDEYAAAIDAETLYSESSIDSSVDSFCDFLTS